jgi:hypothetical protein
MHALHCAITIVGLTDTNPSRFFYIAQLAEVLLAPLGPGWAVAVLAFALFLTAMVLQLVAH